MEKVETSDITISKDEAQLLIALNDVPEIIDKLNSFTVNLLNGVLTNENNKTLQSLLLLPEVQKDIQGFNTYVDDYEKHSTTFCKEDLLKTLVTQDDMTFFMYNVPLLFKKTQKKSEHGILLLIKSEQGYPTTCYSQYDNTLFYNYMNDVVGIDEQLLSKLDTHKNIAFANFFITDLKTITILIQQNPDVHIVKKTFETEEDTLRYIKSIMPDKLRLPDIFQY